MLRPCRRSCAGACRSSRARPLRRRAGPSTRPDTRRFAARSTVCAPRWRTQPARSPFSLAARSSTRAAPRAAPGAARWTPAIPGRPAPTRAPAPEQCPIHARLSIRTRPRASWSSRAHARRQRAPCRSTRPRIRPSARRSGGSRPRARLTAADPSRCRSDRGTLFVDDAAPQKPDPAIVELAELFRRQLIGTLTLNAGADARVVAHAHDPPGRAPEDVRADGGIARLCGDRGRSEHRDPARSTTPKSYGNGRARPPRRSIVCCSAALTGAPLELDETGMRLLLDIVGDPARLDELMAQSREQSTADRPLGRDGGRVHQPAARARRVRRPRSIPTSSITCSRQVGQAAGRLSADGMLTLLAQRTQPGGAGRIGRTSSAAVVERMTDRSVAQFVSRSVIAERGATDRLAQAFQTLVPEIERAAAAARARRTRGRRVASSATTSASRTCGSASRRC